MMAAGFTLANGVVIFHPSVGRDDIGHPVHEVCVPCSRQANRLRKDGGTPSTRPPCSARLIPPVIGGNIQRHNGGHRIPHRQHFFLQSQAAHEIGCRFFRTEVRIAEWRNARAVLPSQKWQQKKNSQKQPTVLHSSKHRGERHQFVSLAQCKLAKVRTTTRSASSFLGSGTFKIRPSAFCEKLTEEASSME